MRLVIKDYLSQLKEKDELDLLLCDLLLQMGYNTDNRPKSGNRQYGVDIQAHSESEILLCTVKQGNINRTIWDNGPNSVRQSLNEILDVYLHNLSPIDQKKEIQIIVASNGVLEENVKLDWNGFIRRNNSYNGKEIIINFWGIDDIVNYVEKYLFDEYLFTQSMQIALRKALYFVGEQDYKKVYYEQIIDSYINQIQEYIDKKDKTTNKQFRKLVSGLYLATQMIAQYAANARCYKISIMVSEYLIICYWKYLLLNKLFEKTTYIEWLTKFCLSYEKWNEQYYLTVHEYCEKKDAFPNYNIVEQKVLLYEVAGFLSSYAHYLFDVNSDKVGRTINTVIYLVNNNPQFFYPPYDAHIGILNMIYRLLVRCGRQEDVEVILANQAICLMDYYKFYKKYPAPTDSFQEALDIEFGNITEDYEISGLWGYLLLWIGILKNKELYEKIKKFLDDDLKNVTKCIWFLRANEEEFFYNRYAMNYAGEGIELKTENNFEIFIKKINYILEQYVDEKFSYEMYSFPSLEMIVCRYYGYVPKVQVGEGKNSKE